MSEPTPLVTIITPCYNLERYIGRCVGSAVAQTYPHWEQFVIDDGSTDHSAEIVASFNDPRIHYLQLPHRGLEALAATYNHGMAHARGSLVAILEGDDFWPADKLEKQVPSFASENVLLSWGNALKVDGDDAITGAWRLPHEASGVHTIAGSALFKLLTRKNILTPAATVMIRRHAIDRVGGFQQLGGATFVDLSTWLKVLANVAGDARFIPECLAYYRLHATQMSVEKGYDMRYRHYDIVQTVLRQMDEMNLNRIGWTDADARAALASASLTRGVAELRAHQNTAALHHFRTLWRETSQWRERVAAALGIISARSPVNVLELALRATGRAVF